MSATNVANWSAAGSRWERLSAEASLVDSPMQMASTIRRQIAVCILSPLDKHTSRTGFIERPFDRFLQNPLARLDERPGLLVAAAIGVGLVVADIPHRAVAIGCNRYECTSRRCTLREQLVFDKRFAR